MGINFCPLGKCDRFYLSQGERSHIIQNPLREQRCQELLQDITEVQENYLSDNFKRGSVADLMSEID